MGGLFKRNKAPGLREQLFIAVHERSPSLAELCAQHESEILSQFKEWLCVPEPLRKNEQAVQYYGQGLIGIAEHFQQVRGDDRLISQFQKGPSGENPMELWANQLNESQDLIALGRLDEAKAMMDSVITDILSMKGTGVEQFLPVALGRLGEVLFRMGRLEEAIPVTKEALTICERTNDVQGVLSYQGNLFEMALRTGDHAEAARLGETLIHNYRFLGAEQQAQYIEKKFREFPGT